MFIEKLNDFICTEAPVSGKGVMDSFIMLFVLGLKERCDLPYQLKSKERLSSIKIKVIVFSQVGQKKINDFSTNEYSM